MISAITISGKKMFNIKNSEGFMLLVKIANLPILYRVNSIFLGKIMRNNKKRGSYVQM